MFEKPRVRETADRANAALDKLERAVKARWSNQIKAEFKELSGKAAGAKRGQLGIAAHSGTHLRIDQFIGCQLPNQ